MKRKIAITGGIGSGKSVVCHALRCLSYPVYDCDSRARELMDNSSYIRGRISSEISAEAINADGSINRPKLSAVVFSDAQKLQQLNALVHGAVRADFATWCASQTSQTIFVETAILYESGFDALVNEVWEITAPDRLRICRVERRSGLTAEEIQRRIDSQCSVCHNEHRIIVNDDTTPLLPQIFTLLKV